MKKTILLFVALSALTGCANPADTKRLASIVDLALEVATRRGAITADDARDVRGAKTIVLDPAPETSGK